MKAKLAELHLGNSKLDEIKQRFRKSLADGLSTNGKMSSLKMLPTYVRDTPDGSGEVFSQFMIYCPTRPAI